MGIYRVIVRSSLATAIEGYMFERGDSFGRLLSLYIDSPAYLDWIYKDTIA